MSHPAVSRADWTAARKKLLRLEKAQTRMRDMIAAERRALPWVKVEKEYVFDAPEGRMTLGDLFEGKSQLIVKHFMMGPGWKEGCVGCSFECDHIEGALLHLPHHDVAFAAVARAPIVEIEAFRRRMGWRFRWVSSFDSDFNYDYNVSFRPEEMEKGAGVYNYETIAPPIEELSGLSVFHRSGEGAIHHTYSAFGRGAEEILGAYMLLDLTPKGRNEPKRGDLTDWVRHHDRYGADGSVEKTGRYRAGGDPCCAPGESG